MKLLQGLINNPNPFQALLAIKIADKSGFTNTNMAALLKVELPTLKEILQSNALKDEKTVVLTFLNKYSNAGNDKTIEGWIQKL
jgi:hypothetical protein